MGNNISEGRKRNDLKLCAYITFFIRVWYNFNGENA